MIAVTILLAVILSIWWVLIPILRDEKTNSLSEPSPASSTNPQDESLMIQQLIDLEYDYRTGKLSDEEYKTQKKEILHSN